MWPLRPSTPCLNLTSKRTDRFAPTFLRLDSSNPFRDRALKQLELQVEDGREHASALFQALPNGNGLNGHHRSRPLQEHPVISGLRIHFFRNPHDITSSVNDLRLSPKAGAEQQ